MLSQFSLPFLLGALFLGMPAPAGDQAVAPPLASGQWAVGMNLPGLVNFHRVTDELYRGGQLTPEGVAQLRQIGIRTIVSFRVRDDRRMIRRSGMDYVHIPFIVWQPDEDEVVRFLQVIADKNRRPVYIYCTHGADRTGMMCAVYRLAVCSWSREEALREMTQGGFDNNPVWKKIRNFVQTCDIERLKQRAGLASD